MGFPGYMKPKVKGTKLMSARIPVEVLEAFDGARAAAERIGLKISVTEIMGKALQRATHEINESLRIHAENEALRVKAEQSKKKGKD